MCQVASADDFPANWTAIEPMREIRKAREMKQSRPHSTINESASKMASDSQLHLGSKQPLEPCPSEAGVHESQTSTREDHAYACDDSDHSNFKFVRVTLSSKTDRFFAVRESGTHSDVALSWTDVLHLWKERDGEFHTAFAAALRAFHAEDYFWECAPLTSRKLMTTFEFVLTAANGTLSSRSASPSPYAAKMRNSCNAAVNFLNFSGDAMLIVPTHDSSTHMSTYCHIASFARGAARAQQMELWSILSEILLQMVTDNPTEPVWVSTDGRGATWVTIRIDRRPKYIKHRPYLSIDREH